jgi:hypothetical protein
MFFLFLFVALNSYTQFKCKGGGILECMLGLVFVCLFYYLRCIVVTIAHRYHVETVRDKIPA